MRILDVATHVALFVEHFVAAFDYAWIIEVRVEISQMLPQKDLIEALSAILTVYVRNFMSPQNVFFQFLSIKKEHAAICVSALNFRIFVQ
jgi:hypothetical protein